MVELRLDSWSVVVLHLAFLASGLLAEEPPAAPVEGEETVQAEPTQAEPAESEIVATWKGRHLERSDYESWRAFHELEDSPGAVREMIFVLSLAEITRGRGDTLEKRLQLEAARHQVLVPRLEQYVEASVEVSDEEIEKLRRELPDAFKRPKKVKLLNIHQRLDEEDPELTRRRMEELRRRLLDGADFEELAREHSQSQSRFRGGQLGFLALEDLPPPVAAAVEKLEIGQLTEVVEHGGGLTIARLEEVREAVVPSPDEVRRKLRKNLTRQRQVAAWDELRQGLVEGAKILPPSAEGGPLLEVADFRLDPPAVETLARLQFPQLEPAEVPAEQLEAMLRAWAFRVAAVRHARELGLDREPEVAARLRWALEGTLARLELVRRIDERLAAAGPPDEARLRRAFEADRRFHTRPPQTLLDVIHFGEPPEESPRAWLEKVQDVVRAVENGETSFEQAARDHSIHPTAPAGGELGWRTQRAIAQWGPVFARAVRALEPGESSGLLRLESGLWLVRLRDRRAGEPVDFAEARALVEKKVRRERIEELERRVRAEHLATLDIEILDGR